MNYFQYFIGSFEENFLECKCNLVKSESISNFLRFQLVKNSSILIIPNKK